MAALASACGSFGDGDGKPAAGAEDGDLTLRDLPVRMAPFVEGTFTQEIDHPLQAAPSVGTFAQRYWYSTEFATSPQSPVLFYICGEWECSREEGASLADSAKTLGAAIVVLEHRYYGQSVPFVRLPIENMKYLTMRHALEDAASFQRFAMANLPLSGKWIAVGGSYAGMLAAYYRLKHPELVVGAWGSSAPINVQLSFWGYDAIAARALGPTCAMQARQALAALSDAWDRNETSTVLDAVGWGRFVPQDKAEFLNWFEWTFAGAPQNRTTRRLCSALAQHESRPLDGLIGYLKPPFADEAAADAGMSDAGSSMSDASTSDGGTIDAGMSDAEGGDSGATSASDGGSAEPSAPRSPLNAGTVNEPRQFRLPVSPGSDDDFSGSEWFYQVCTEVGFWQVFNPDRLQSVMSELNTEDNFRRDCLRYVGQIPDVALTRERYYAPIARGEASNIFLVNGSADPWSSLSFVSQASAPAGVTTYTITDGAHCEDLGVLTRNSLLGVFESHKRFATLARSWIASASAGQ